MLIKIHRRTGFFYIYSSLSICLSIHYFIPLSVCKYKRICCTYLSICLSVGPFIHPWIPLSLYIYAIYKDRQHANINLWYLMQYHKYVYIYIHILLHTRLIHRYMQIYTYGYIYIFYVQYIYIYVRYIWYMYHVYLAHLVEGDQGSQVSGRASSSSSKAFRPRRSLASWRRGPGTPTTCGEFFRVFFTVFTLW